MILISHRGNISGPNPRVENDPVYISIALDIGFDVEVDVWSVSNRYFLGHDFPQYMIENSFLENNKFWCHAKNSEALERMSKNKNIHYFWHQTDDFTLTSKGYIWTYPNKPLLENSICVKPEPNRSENISCAGICSDYIMEESKV